MRWLATIAFTCLLGSTGCVSADDDELTVSQGVCATLDVTSCRLSATCQQAYVDSGHQPFPTPLKCLLVAAPSTAQVSCPTLSKDECRTHNDCTPIYWQDLGPTDGPVGDPYYKRCDIELSPTE